MNPWPIPKGKAPLCDYHLHLFRRHLARKPYTRITKRERRALAWNTHWQCKSCQGREEPKGPPLCRDIDY